jgi:hypothetical protein
MKIFSETQFLSSPPISRPEQAFAAPTSGWGGKTAKLKAKGDFAAVLYHEDQSYISVGASDDPYAPMLEQE